MANITIENGIYSNLENALPNGITTIGNKRISNAANLVTDLETGDTATKLVNAVEIDWNGAQVKLNGDSTARTINTTGDLINAIVDASEVGGSSTDTTYSFTLNGTTHGDTTTNGISLSGTNPGSDTRIGIYAPTDAGTQGYYL